MLGRGVVGVAEFVIDEYAADTRGVREDPVEDFARGFVLLKPSLT